MKAFQVLEDTNNDINNMWDQQISGQKYEVCNDDSIAPISDQSVSLEQVIMTINSLSNLA